MPYLTPLSTPTGSICWRVFIPNEQRALAAFRGQMLELLSLENWEQTDGITTGETTELFDIVYETMEIGCLYMIGALVHYVTATPPTSILPCDGSQHLRVDYPDLYAVLPASLIVDADNFITPTIEDKFLLAAGTTYSSEDTGGETEHTLTVAELPAHSHTYDKETYNVDIETVGVPDPTGVGLPAIPTATSNTGNSDPHNNMPPFVAYKVGIVAK